MDENLDLPEDVSADYLRHAQDQSADAELAAFRARVRARQGGEAAAEAEPAAAPPGAVLSSGGGITIRSVAGAAGSAIGAAAADLGGGFVESVPAVLGGVTDAVRNAAGGLDNLGDWLNANVADLTFDVPSTGADTLDAMVKPFLNPVDTVAALPKLPEQKTVTGGVIREGARFLTGFFPALRVVGGSGAGAAIGAGAASDFATQDPSAGGVSNLVQSVPALKNPVTEYLATDPDQPEAVNRLRHAVEGAGFGGMAEGVFRGIRAVAQAKKAKGEIETQAAAGAERDMLWLGDPAADHVLVARGDAAGQAASFDKLATAVKTAETGVPDAVAARGVEQSAKRSAAPPAKTAPPEVFVNFARINTADDVQTAIRDLANAFKGEIDGAKRGVQTRAQTEELADSLGMSVEDLLARRQGQPLNAEEALAARRLWVTSAEKLLEAAQKAAGGNAGNVDLYHFRRMLAVHHAIQSEVIAARTETARALQSWAIPAGSGAEQARMIEQLVEVSGGQAVSQELAKRFAALANQGLPPGALANMVRRGWAATTMDMVKESYVLGLLWSPSTHLVNSASNLTVAFQQVYERSAARALGDFLGSAVDARVVDGEALAMTYGMVTSLKDALRLGLQAARSGQATTQLTKIDLSRPRAISAETVARERQLSLLEAQQFAESPMGRAIDFVGAVTRAPGNLLAGEDEFFKTIAYRAEVHAQALRQATQDGLTGPARFERMAALANDPPEHIRLAAADAALYATFQNKTGWFGESMLKARQSGWLNPLFLVLPFIKTPTNIMRYAFERTPLAPLVGQWRDDIAAGGARRDLALARMATGTALMAVGMDLASSGLITGSGPRDPGKREALLRTGWQPNSIVVGEKYYSFNRLDPVGMLLGFTGSLAEKMKEKDFSPEDFDQLEEVMAAGIGVVSVAVVDKSYFTGVSEVMTAIQRSETSATAAAQFIDRTAGSLLPFSTAFTVLRRFADPVTREVNSPFEAVEAKIVGLADKLPPARDLWGAERQPAEVYGRVYDVVSPAAVSARKQSPVDAELARLSAGVRRIQKKGQFLGADVNFHDYPAAYDEYVRLAGNELKHPAWDLGAKDMLDAVVSGQHPLSDVYRLYSDGPEGGKAGFIKNTVAEYRELAQQAIVAQPERFPDFVAYVTERAQKRKQERQQMDFGPAAGGALQP